MKPATFAAVLQNKLKALGAEPPKSADVSTTSVWLTWGVRDKRALLLKYEPWHRPMGESEPIARAALHVVLNGREYFEIHSDGSISKPDEPSALGPLWERSVVENDVRDHLDAIAEVVATCALWHYRNVQGQGSKCDSCLHQANCLAFTFG